MLGVVPYLVSEVFGRNLNWESILIPETVSCLLDSSGIESTFSIFKVLQHFM